MLWPFIASINPFSHGLANVLDSYFINNPFKKPIVLMFFGAVISVVFLPLIFLIQVPDMLPMNMLLPLLIVAFLNVAYSYPYYKALQHTDVSSVAAMFSLGNIFVPVLAFIIVGEVLSVSQYAGFLIIIVGAFLLGVDLKNRLKMGKALPLMALASFCTSLEAVVYKYMLSSISWSTAFTWSTVLTLVFMIVVVLVSRQWRNVLGSLYKFRARLHLFAAEELLTFVGSAAGIVAISLAPVTLVKGILSTQPVFVLVLAVLIKRQYKHFSFKEEIHNLALVKKLVLFAAIIIGSAMVAT